MQGLKCVLYNACSICNKIHAFIAELQDNDTDIAVVTETWLPSYRNSITAELKAAGYEIKHVFREDRRGGGVAIIHKAGITFSSAKAHNFVSFECISATLPKKTFGGLEVIVVYRHGAIANSIFFTEFQNFIELTQQSVNNFIFCGDFNLHVNKPQNGDIIEFNQILSDFTLSQHVNVPTHKLGNTLDLIITNKNIKVSNINVDLSTDSDHALISFKVGIETIVTQSRSIQVRKCNNLNAFKTDLSEKAVDFMSNAPVNFHDAINRYSDMCLNLVNHHAPVREISIPLNPQPKWMDSEFKNARRQRRSLYKKWARSRKPEDKIAYKNCSKLVHNMSISKRKQFYSNSIANCGNSQKELFKVCDTLMDKQKSAILPKLSYENPIEQANKFNSFFIGKINKIRSKFGNEASNLRETEYHGPKFSEFEPTTTEKLKKVINSKPIKASKNDHIPSFLLKSCLDVVMIMFTFLVNLSLSTACMDGLKDSIVTPLLKKQGADPEDLSNYRPVCDIKYLHKLIEKSVLPQLNSHMSDNNLHIPNQSGYKINHSCESLLLRILNDVFVSIDKGMCTVLILLDLSAAFDTVDHDVLLDILYHEIGLRGTVFKWFESYLRGRRQCVTVNNSKCAFVDTRYGVPQGSVLGPVLFNIYVRSFIKAIEKAGYSIHGYADDHQLSETFRIEFQFNTLRCSVPDCLEIVSSWMSKYFLKLNASKSQVIVFHPQTDSVLIDHVIMRDNSFIRLSDVVTNLGVKLDSGLSFCHQVSSIVSSGYQFIRDIGKIRHYLSTNDLKTLVNSFIISRLDTCNSLLYGISTKELNRLQRLQNSCARLIFGLRKSASVSNIFHEFHWLPIKNRILFKILCFVFKCIHNQAPVYLTSLLQINNQENITLAIPRRLHSIGDRAFSSCGPALWNALPVDIRQIPTLSKFKSQLKHLLFSNVDNYIQVLNRYRC